MYCTDVIMNEKMWNKISLYSVLINTEKNKASSELSAILRMKCCKNFCLHRVSRREVFKAREQFQAKSKSDQRQWIIEHLRSHYEDNGGAVVFLFNVGTTQLCQRGWRLALGITRTRLWQIQRDFGCKYIV